MRPWKSMQFRDFVSLQRGFDLPQQDRIYGAYPVVASTSITAFHNKFRVKAPCVTTGRSGALGEVLYINQDCWPLNTTLWVKDFHGNVPRYVYYKLKTLGLQKFNAGAGVPTLNKNHLDTLAISVPDIPTQTHISSVLSAYDDSIENNEKRIKVLKEMAQLLYTEWFVNFNFPMHLCHPELVEGSSQNIGYKDAGGKMVDSGTEYGMIPEGWEVKSLGNVVSFLEGPGLRNWQYRESGIPFINIRTIGNGDINIANCNYLDRTEVETKYPHFLLNVNDIVLSSSGTLGRLAVVRNRHLPICLNTSVIRFREIKNGLPIWFIKQYLLSEVFQNKIKGLASGAAQLNFGPSHLETISLVIPEADILRIYYQKISLVESEIGVLRDNIQTLSNTRDLLIPQLVTGKRELL